MSEHERVYPNAAQRAICDKYGMAVFPPEEMVAIAIESFGKTPVYGTRMELPEGGDVSWFIHCGEYSAATDFYQPIHVHHVREMLPLVIKYLCLQTSAKFIIPKGMKTSGWLNNLVKGVTT